MSHAQFGEKQKLTIFLVTLYFCWITLYHVLTSFFDILEQNQCHLTHHLFNLTNSKF